MRHVFFELLELRPRQLDSVLRPLDCVLRPLDSVLRATLLDRVDDQEGEDEHEEYAFNRQLKSSKLHCRPNRRCEQRCVAAVRCRGRGARPDGKSE